MNEVLFAFNIADNGEPFTTFDLLFLIGMLLLNAYIWKSKKIGNVKIGILILGIMSSLFLTSLLIYDWRTYSSYENRYENGDFNTLKGYVSHIDTRFRAEEFFTINNKRFTIVRRSGCYSTLTRDNKHFVVNSLVEVKYLDDGCIVELAILKKPSHSNEELKSAAD